MNNFIAILLLLTFTISCSNHEAETKLTPKEVIQEDSVLDIKEETLTTIEDTIEVIDTTELLNYRWLALKYVIDGETIFADTPFSLEFSESSSGKTYTVNNSKQEKKAWSFEKGVLTLQVDEDESYEILMIDSVNLVTKDIGPKGNTYYFLKAI